jgi:DNA-binding NarL/FixJ family response regulator
MAREISWLQSRRGRFMTRAARTRILVVDDHAVVGEALMRLVNRQKDLICCGRIESAGKIIPAIKKRKPDVILLDLLLKNEDAIWLIPSLVSKFPALRVLAFSQLDEFSHAESVLKAGAQGYVTKQETTREILTAIRTVVSGEVYLSRKMAARLLHKFVEKKPSGSGKEFPLEPSLTRRESQVLQLIGSGRKTGEIAGELNLSVKTVESHRENIKRKLGVQTAPELVHHAIRWVEGRTPQSSLFP